MNKKKTGTIPVFFCVTYRTYKDIDWLDRQKSHIWRGSWPGGTRGIRTPGGLFLTFYSSFAILFLAPQKPDLHLFHAVISYENPSITKPTSLLMRFLLI